jgi:cytochrome c-type biogenesis protein CcmE
MTRKGRRLWLLLICGLGVSVSAGLSLWALSDNLQHFVSPSDLATVGAGGRTVRLGGLVEKGSVQRATQGRPSANFRVTDGANSVAVTYAGILPDLFREGQGVVALGVLRPDGGFQASEVLAKHDETYMPKEVAEALKKSGHWNPDAGPPPSAALWNTIPTKPPGGG